MSAREEVLARIRAALGPPRPAVPIPRDYRGVGGRALADPLGLLAERLRDYRATVHRCPPEGVAARVAAAVERRGPLLVAPGLSTEWLPAGLRPLDSAPGVPELDAAPGVLTGCRVAIAETGTLVLAAGAAGDGSRALTLVPDYHLVVVRPEQVVAGVPDALARLDGRTPQTWISGPSATSDIELDRVEGVHGPRTLEVILIEAGQAPQPA